LTLSFIFFFFNIFFYFLFNILLSTGASATLTGLTPATAYTLRVRAKDAAGNLSALSAAVTFTTAAAPVDTTAPTTPGTPVASAITSSGATLTWAASTDNVGVTGYTVFRRVGTTDTQLATSTGPTTALTGLTAATAYTVVVRARDAAGNLSAASNPVTFTTLTGGGGGGGCTAAYTITNSWAGGFQGSVVVTNTATTASTSWTVTWTFANGQVITQLWGGLVTQTGTGVSVRNETWNGALSPNATATFGFLVDMSGTTNTIPTLTCSRTP